MSANGSYAGPLPTVGARPFDGRQCAVREMQELPDADKLVFADLLLAMGAGPPP